MNMNFQMYVVMVYFFIILFLEWCIVFCQFMFINKDNLFLILVIVEDEGDGDIDKKRQKRGGKGQIKIKKKLEFKGIRLGTVKRGKKKYIIVVIGLGIYGQQFGISCRILFVWKVVVFIRFFRGI